MVKKQRKYSKTPLNRLPSTDQELTNAPSRKEVTNKWQSLLQHPNLQKRRTIDVPSAFKIVVLNAFFCEYHSWKDSWNHLQTDLQNCEKKAWNSSRPWFAQSIHASIVKRDCIAWTFSFIPSAICAPFKWHLLISNTIQATFQARVFWMTQGSNHTLLYYHSMFVLLFTSRWDPSQSMASHPKLGLRSSKGPLPGLCPEV